MAFEADRSGKRGARNGQPMTGAQKLKARAADAVAEIKSRVSGKRGQDRWWPSRRSRNRKHAG